MGVASLYCVYSIGADDRILSRIDLRCESDADAIRKAEILVDWHTVEIWKDNKLLRAFDARE